MTDTHLPILEPSSPRKGPPVPPRTPRTPRGDSDSTCTTPKELLTPRFADDVFDENPPPRAPKSKFKSKSSTQDFEDHSPASRRSSSITHKNGDAADLVEIRDNDSGNSSPDTSTIHITKTHKKSRKKRHSESHNRPPKLKRSKSEKMTKLRRRTTEVKGSLALTASQEVEFHTQYRYRLVNEIVETEKTYIDSLEKLLQMFAPLLELKIDSPEFPSTELQTLNSNAGIIIEYSKLLLDLFIPRVATFDNNTCVGDIFLSLADYLKVYTQYVKVYSSFMQKFINCTQKIKAVKEVVSTSTQFLSFESCLIVPVQRIPRYQLLLQDLKKHTPTTHADYEKLVQALEKISAIGNYVNDMQRFYEGINQVLELHRRFGKQLTDGTGVNEFVRSHRRLLREDTFNMLDAKSGRWKPVKAYLLTDLVLVGGLNDSTSNSTSSSKNQENKLYHLICLWLAEIVCAPSPSASPDVESSPLCILSFVKDEEETIQLQEITEGQAATWAKETVQLQEKLQQAITKGADIEAEKFSVAENVRWNRAKIPMEIAQALAQEQAQKRAQAQIVSLVKDEPTPAPTHRDREKRGGSIITSMATIRNRSSTAVGMLGTLPRFTLRGGNVDSSDSSDGPAPLYQIPTHERRKSRGEIELSQIILQEFKHQEEAEQQIQHDADTAAAAAAAALIASGGSSTNLLSPKRKSKSATNSPRNVTHTLTHTISSSALSADHDSIPTATTTTTTTTTNNNNNTTAIQIEVSEKPSRNSLYGRRKANSTSRALTSPLTSASTSDIKGTSTTPRPIVRSKQSASYSHDLAPNLLGKLFVRVLEARKLNFKHTNDTKDAFVAIELNGKQFHTSVAKKSVHPVWKEQNQFVFDLLVSSHMDDAIYLQISLLDAASKKSPMVGEITIKLDPNKLTSRTADRWFVLKKKAKPSGEIRLQLHFKNSKDILASEDYEMDIFEEKCVDDSLTLSEQRLVEYLAAVSLTDFSL